MAHRPRHLLFIGTPTGAQHRQHRLPAGARCAAEIKLIIRRPTERGSREVRRCPDRDGVCHGKRVRCRWPAYLRERSGLPGSRANLTLVRAVADAGDPALFETLVGTDDEYLVLCGVVGLGRLLAEDAGAGVSERLRTHATDARWRVREGVAMALQCLGDADLGRLLDLVTAWAADPHPLVQRAAVAGICEPRLVRSRNAATRAIELCDRVTRDLAARSRGERRDDGVRALRQKGPPGDAADLTGRASSSVRREPRYRGNPASGGRVSPYPGGVPGPGGWSWTGPGRVRSTRCRSRPAPAVAVGSARLSRPAVLGPRYRSGGGPGLIRSRAVASRCP